MCLPTSHTVCVGSYKTPTLTPGTEVLGIRTWRVEIVDRIGQFFFNRLHLHQDWHQLLTECKGVPATEDRHDSQLYSAVKLTYVETTKEVGTQASERGIAQGAILRAYGILNGLFFVEVCTVYVTIMQSKATSNAIVTNS